MNHRKFIADFINYIAQNQGSIMINSYEVNGAKHCQSEVGGIVGDVDASVILGGTESSAVFNQGKPRFRDWQNHLKGGSLVRIEATRDFVRVYTDKEESSVYGYRELNYSDEGGFGSTMPWETEEEFKDRCDRINSGLGLVTS